MIRRGILKCMKMSTFKRMWVYMCLRILILNSKHTMIATKVNSDLSGYII